MLQVNTIDDKKDYGVVNKAMKMIGFSDRERETVWKIVAAIIHLVGYIYGSLPSCCIVLDVLLNVGNILTVLFFSFNIEHI